MALTAFYADAYAVVSCDQDSQLVEIRWLKHCSGEPLRNVLSKALECATAYQLTAWLCDVRRLYYIEPSDQAWMLQHLFPRFNRQKQHRVALLVNKNNFELLATVQTEKEQAFEGEYGPYIDMIYFMDREGAEDWLLL